jgi:hypothetical protein
MALTEHEMEKLERQVSDDLLFDYSKEEVDICFDECYSDDLQPTGVMCVTLHDLRFMKPHKARERT